MCSRRNFEISCFWIKCEKKYFRFIAIYWSASAVKWNKSLLFYYSQVKNIIIDYDIRHAFSWITIFNDLLSKEIANQILILADENDGNQSVDELSSDDQMEDDPSSHQDLRVPSLFPRPETSLSSSNESISGSSSLTSGLIPSDFSPWLYRPTPLPGYLSLQTGFLTSRFSGNYISILNKAPNQLFSKANKRWRWERFTS